MSSCTKFKREIDGQKQHWNKMYAKDPSFFGDEPSYAAKKAAEIFEKQRKLSILELGAGQGRDSLFMAKSGLKVQAIDYSENAIQAINQKAKSEGLAHYVSAIQHDIRKPLPFADKSFDGCYCHMLYCMALCTSELEVLFQEVRRVLKPNALNIYTVRHTGDAHYGRGIHCSLF